MSETVTYTLKLTTDAPPRDPFEEFVYLEVKRALFGDGDQIHPLDFFGETFKRSLLDAGLAFADPKVHRVPVYQEGRLEPVAYVVRSPAK